MLALWLGTGVLARSATVAPPAVGGGSKRRVTFTRRARDEPALTEPAVETERTLAPPKSEGVQYASTAWEIAANAIFEAQKAVAEKERAKQEREAARLTQEQNARASMLVQKALAREVERQRSVAIEAARRAADDEAALIALLLAM